MNLRKLAALVAALGLIVGLFGSSISATFLQSLSATETITVASFDCGIIPDGTTSGAVIAGGGMSVSYTPPTVTSSTGSSAPFTFVVKNSGAAPALLNVAAPAVSGPFSVLGTPLPSGVLAANGTSTVATGIAWTELSRANLGSITFTWTITCNEYVAPVPGTPLIHYAFNSTNAENIAGTAPGHPGTIGPSVSVVDNGGGSLTLNFTAGSQTTYAHCFEYVTNDNTPEQKIAENGGVNFNTNDTVTHVTVLDGLFPYTCLYNGHPTDSVTLNAGAGGYVDVRMVFGAEADFRFDWTRFNAL